MTTALLKAPRTERKLSFGSVVLEIWVRIDEQLYTRSESSTLLYQAEKDKGNVFSYWFPSVGPELIPVYR